VAGDGGVCTKPPPGDNMAQLTLHGFSPLEAKFDEELLIEGENFSTVLLENSVRLNGVPAVVLLATKTALRIAVPKNMRCTGLIEVTVGEETATSTTPFTYMPTATVSTFAGSGTAGFHDGGGTSAQFDLPGDLTMDAEGNLYVVDINNYRIRKVTPEGEVSTVAGNGNQGLLDGTGTDTQFHSPWGLTIGLEGNLYVADAGNHRIRKVVLPSGEVSTFAGGGGPGIGEGGYADGLGEAARFNTPDGIAADLEGNLYVADSNNHCIRKVTPGGLVSTFVGNGTSGFVDATGTAARFNDPNGVAIDNRTGTLYVADSKNHRIRKVTPGRVVTTLAGSGVADFLDGPGKETQFNFPHGTVMDERNNYLYVADSDNHRIRMVRPDGVVSTLAGGGVQSGHVDGPGALARFSQPHAVVIDAEGNLYVADLSNNSIRKITLE